MSDDFMGNLGSAFGGLVDSLSQTGLVPKDDPAVKLLGAQKEVSNLKKQEAEIYAEIGRQAFAAAPETYAQGDKLRLIQSNLADAEGKLNALKQELDEAKRAEEEARKAEEEARRAREAAGAATRCQSCGNQNPEGTQFCQECGTKLGAPAKAFCTSCGAELTAGARFCGACGTRQE
ncbi:MAG: zinc ribbon domain-containing protein [Acidobacteriota bacterium]|jgi:hypothetical protein|nr:zinc ribbon domain-containing protein [Acidobacteriota bacterium]